MLTGLFKNLELKLLRVNRRIRLDYPFGKDGQMEDAAPSPASPPLTRAIRVPVISGPGHTPFPNNSFAARNNGASCTRKKFGSLSCMWQPKQEQAVQARLR